MATLTFKVTDEEARLIRSRARRERVTVSEYLRRRASLSLAPARKPAKVRCPHTGAMIFVSPDNQPPLTTDAVRELLSDFP
jgi:mobilization protein NikA